MKIVSGSTCATIGTIVVLVLPMSSSFRPGVLRDGIVSHTTRLSTELPVLSRRDSCTSMMQVILASTVGAGAIPTVAHADLNFEQVQDLLKDIPTSGVEYTTSSTGRPKYLTEPTEEFRANEIRASEFKRQQLKAKAQFQSILDQLQSAPNDETVLTDTLNALTLQVRAIQGLPEGITKEEVIKQVRRRKAKKFWPTRVEIAYQDLLSEIQYQQSPNTGGGVGEKKFL